MKVLHLDLETSYTIGAVWGMWETDVAAVLQDSYILGIGYSWDHLSAVHWKGLPDFPLYKRDPRNDKELMKFILELLGECDVVVAHNGRAFDTKKINGRLFIHGLPPPKPYALVDTKTESKQFGFISNKLDELARMTFGERKLKNDGIVLWTRCMADKYDKEAWDQMERYCKKDVILLKKYYQRIVGWVKNHPNWNLDGDRPPCCRNCGSGLLTKKGKLAYSNKDMGMTGTTLYYRYRCKNCGKWLRGGVYKRTDIR